MAANWLIRTNSRQVEDFIRFDPEENSVEEEIIWVIQEKTMTTDGLVGPMSFPT